MATGDDKPIPSPSSVEASMREVLRTLRRMSTDPPPWLKPLQEFQAKLSRLRAELDDEAKAKPSQEGSTPQLTEQPQSRATPPDPQPPFAPPVPEVPTAPFAEVAPEPVPAAAPEPKLSPSAQWCCARVRELKATNQISEDTKITALAHRLEDELAEASKADDTDTLDPLTWRYIRNELQAWGVWPFDRI